MYFWIIFIQLFHCHYFYSLEQVIKKDSIQDFLHVTISTDKNNWILRKKENQNCGNKKIKSLDNTLNLMIAIFLSSSL